MSPKGGSTYRLLIYDTKITLKRKEADGLKMAREKVQLD